MPYVFHEAVFETERRRIENRRNAVDKTWAAPSRPQETVGLALSGGGIRSATFSLGVLQSLAQRGLLKSVDYLSTVSGGGYAGCYLGSHFLPPALRKGDPAPSAQKCRDWTDNVYKALQKSPIPTQPSSDSAGVRSVLVRGSDEEAPTAAQTAPTTEQQASTVAQRAFEWLRNNGRYLAPRGAGDLIYVVAMQIRNWAAVQYVVGVMIVFLLLGFSTGRSWLIAKVGLWQQIELLFLPEPGAAIYWSPGWVLVGAFGAIALLPPALAFWLAHSRVDRKRELSWMPLWHEGAIIFLLLLVLIWAYSVLVVLHFMDGLPLPSAEMPKVFWAAVAYVCISLLAIGIFLLGLDLESRRRKAWFLLDLGLVLALVGLLLAAALTTPSAVRRPWWWVAIGLLTLALILSVRGAQRVELDLKGLRTRFTLWLGWTFRLFLIGAGLALLGTIGQTVYAYAFLEEPGVGGLAGVASVIAAIVAGARQLFKWLGSGNKQTHPRIPLDALAGVAAVLLLLLTGGAWATVVQAALWKGGPPPSVPTELVCGQDCPDAPRTWDHARTIDVSPWKARTDSVSVPLDPQGVLEIRGKPVAVAPGWMSVLWVGVLFLFFTTGMFLNFINMSSLHQFYAARLGRAYLGATNGDRFKQGGLVAVTTPLLTDRIRLEAYYHGDVAAPVHLINVTVNQTRPHKAQLVQRDRKGMGMAIGPGYTIVNSAVFHRDDKTGNLMPLNDEAAKLADLKARQRRRFDSEELDLGDWCAISGAAFSTGLGMRTSLGLSLLAGLANVRLGYWWNFNTEKWRSGQLAAYRYLWGELMADFKGPWKPFWFLTDGGHFDNTGAYELVRRRVGTILLCDNGCDPRFRFDDLGNLARKIRMDFDAEMWPVSPKQLGGYFGTPEDFADPERRKGKCALLFEIRYPRGAGEPAERGTLLIVIKPNLIPEVRIDVVQYAAVNREFPHQSTLDQFFDDAQWESYRKLGETIADSMLDADALRVDGWRRTHLIET